jgi:hypothetical protein
LIARIQTLATIQRDMLRIDKRVPAWPRSWLFLVVRWVVLAVMYKMSDGPTRGRCPMFGVFSSKISEPTVFVIGNVIVQLTVDRCRSSPDGWLRNLF